MNFKKLLIHLTVAVVLVMALVFGSMIFLDVATMHGKVQIVPDFTNMSVAEAKSLAADSYMRIDVIDSLYVKRMAKGHIYRQTPKAGCVGVCAVITHIFHTELGGNLLAPLCVQFFPGVFLTSYGVCPEVRSYLTLAGFFTNHNDDTILASRGIGKTSVAKVGTDAIELTLGELRRQCRKQFLTCGLQVHHSGDGVMTIGMVGYIVSHF